jgi:flavin reductase (DIM6/NTAB) family NADH-FMN oxidoreductase RutF
MSVSIEAFKATLGGFPSGVTVVTAWDQAGRLKGMTASAFCSVSLDPPLVLVCPSKRADCYAALTEASVFSIHLLAGDQADLAWQFSKSGLEKTEGVEVADGPEGAPRLPGAFAYLVCRPYALYDGGDHGILVGEVIALEPPSATQTPLAYCRGQLGALPPLTSS